MKGTTVYGAVSVSMLIALAAPARPASAQQQPKWTTTTDILREHEWGDETNNLLDIVMAMPDDKYAFRPNSQMRSFGEVVGHITDVQFGFCDAASGLKVDRGSWEKKPSKVDALQGLHASIAACDSAFDRLSDDRLNSVVGATTLSDLFITMLGHTRRETGKLVAYLPIAGVKPPEIHYMRGRVWRKSAAP
jgi:uncharacterized damage-inducible protein DinB